MTRAVMGLWLFLFVSVVASAQSLEVVSAGPSGQLDTIQRAAEVRVTFSEPMVALEKVPPTVAAPFFRIEPPVAGTFRWIGTSTLAFIPTTLLPYGTTWRVIVDRSAKSIRGRTLNDPYAFSFTTPNILIIETRWYRKSNAEGAPVIVGVWFNQPIDRAQVHRRLQLRYVPFEPEIPALPAATDEQSRSVYARKRNVAINTSKLDRTLTSTVASKWNVEILPDDKQRLLVIETQTGIPFGSQIEVEFQQPTPGIAREGRDQNLIRLDPFFFVKSLSCTNACDPGAYNALTFTGRLLRKDVAPYIKVEDVTLPENVTLLKPRKMDDQGDYPSNEISLDSLGYSLLPARTYRVTVDPAIKASDDQTLGYRWVNTIENWHLLAFSSFGEGDGVWESSGGTLLPFYARNLQSVKQQMTVLTEETILPTVMKLQTDASMKQPGAGKTRALKGEADKINSHGMEVRDAIGADARGLLWVTLSDETPIARSSRSRIEPRSSVVQFTNLGITAKYSPVNTLIFVTTLDTGLPVEGATVKLRSRDNKVRLEGITDKDGLYVAPTPADVSMAEPWELLFLITASKAGDFAYVGSNWSDGIRPYDFEIYSDTNGDPDVVRSSVFSDRGIYKPGEEVRIKGIFRLDASDGMKLFPAGTSVEMSVTDVRGNRVVSKTLKLSAWSSAEMTFKLGSEATLGDYSIEANVGGREQAVYVGGFTVGSYRRPQFRVDTSLASPQPIAGSPLLGTVSARYLSGAAMSGRNATIALTRQAVVDVPAAISNRYPEERFRFGGIPSGREGEEDPYRKETIATEEKKLAANGTTQETFDTTSDTGVANVYTFESNVQDLSRQRISARSAFLVHPASYYVGISKLPYFVSSKNVSAEVIAVALNGTAVIGARVDAELVQIQWNSVRRAEGGGFYTWDTERQEVPSGSWSVSSAATPVPLNLTIKQGGEFELRLSSTDEEGRKTITVVDFYASLDGYTAWQRYDHNRIDLEPEKKRYQPGDTARILIRSPWEKATALVTTEREGIRSQRRFALNSTQETIELPITEQDIPNIYVSVLLIKGRSAPATDKDPADPGKPAFRLGYTALQIENLAKKLDVKVKADKSEYRPGGKATVSIKVVDVQKKPVRAEVTLWAVDYGVLSLTGYRERDVVADIYAEKGLLVATADSRQKIISRRVITPKGAAEGGGGGRDLSASSVRKDFRPLAFWLGSIETDAKGEVKTTVTLPESLTTYRIMAVAADSSSRFGSGATEIRTDKPVQLRPTFPRFLTKGDVAQFGAVVANQARQRGRAIVTLESLDKSASIVGDASQSLDIDAGGTKEVTWKIRGNDAGTARFRMTVRLGNESDAFEDSFPVRLFMTPEAVVATGRTDSSATELLRIPENVVPGIGALDTEIASTALVGLSEGSRYLVTYPYGCAEQRASALLGVILPAHIGAAYPLPDVNPAELRVIAEKTIRDLESYETEGGGFSYWRGMPYGDPYTTAWITHVLHVAKRLGYTVSDEMLQRAYGYMSGWVLTDQTPVASLRPYELARRAFVIKTLAEGTTIDHAQIERIANAYERMPVFAVTFLFDAMNAAKYTGALRGELDKKMRSSIAPEATTAHVDEWSDRELDWLWSSNTRSTAIVLGSLVRNTNESEVVHRMVRWLMERRKNGRWDDTQENAWALLGIVDYAAKFEKDVPAFAATVSLGETKVLSERFEGRSTTSKKKRLTLDELRSIVKASEIPLEYLKTGTGTLHYTSRLSYAIDPPTIDAVDRGFKLTRTYEALESKKAAGSFKAGDVVRVTLTIATPKERSFVAISDPLPAGFEIVDTTLETTAQEGTEAVSEENKSGFDHVERRDDRLDIFATRLPGGQHKFTYVVRATTSGTFRTPPATALEMYEPEVFGRTDSTTIEVKP